MPYTSITAFLADLPPEQEATVSFLHQLILKEIPDSQGGIKWNIPFYDGKRNLCFLNPKEKHIEIGFAFGAFLPNQNGLLVGNGKKVRHIKFGWNEEIPLEGIREILAEAAAYDSKSKK